MSLLPSALRRTAGLLLPGILVLGATALPADAAPNPLDLTPPTASFGVTPQELHHGEPVHFDASSSSDMETLPQNLRYSWDFGDGTTVAVPGTSAVAVDHTYVASGVYTVVLTVTDSGDHTDTETKVLNVDDTAPVAAFTRTPTTAKVAQVVSFDASSTSDAETPDDELTYAWDFGDTTSGTGRTTTHAYSTAGTKAVTLTVTDPQGATSTKTLNVTVTNAAPTANGTISPSSPHVAQTVTFDGSTSTDGETPDALTYTWSFGDGSDPSSQKVATHTYTQPSPQLSSYTVTLTVKDPQNLSSTKTFNLVVGANQSPTASAQASQSRANLGQSVTLTSTGSSDPEGESLTYAWNFDDGGTTTDATTSSTTASWSTPGAKTVTLTVTDTQGNTGTATMTVTVGNQAPTADATATPNPARRLQVVTFDGSGSTDAETPGSLTYSWSFSDGASTPYSSSPTAEHAWATTGSKSATLSVKDALGVVGTDTVNLLVVTNNAPTAKATATPTAPEVGETVAFDAGQSTDQDGDALTYLWEFPGGATATTKTVNRAFATTGAKQVKLTVTDPYGVSSTDQITVTVVNTAPTAVITADSTVAAIGGALELDGSDSTDKESPGDLTYAWDFGDETTDNGPQTSHAWAQSGSYVVTLTVTDAEGLTDTETVTVTVTNGEPVAVIDPNPGSVAVTKSLQLDGSGSADPEGGVLTYAWDFGDGSTGTGATVSHAWDAVGSYDVVLAVTDPAGKTGTATSVVTVTNAAPTAVVSPTSATRAVTKTLELSGTGSTDPEGGALTYAWDFDDGSTGTGATVSHAWAAEGTYDVVLTVTDPQGLVDSATATVTVTNAAPTAVVSPTSATRAVTKTLDLDGTGSTDPEGGALTYAWDFDDGSTGTGATVSHAWAAEGTYDVVLTVTDTQGKTGTATSTVTVTNAAPTVRLNLNGYGSVGTKQEASYDANGSSDPDTGSSGLTYAWTFSDGGTATGREVNHTWTRGGSRTVKVTVTDPQGASASLSKTVKVFETLACESSKVVRTGWTVRTQASANDAKACVGTDDSVMRFRFAGTRLDVFHGTRKDGGVGRVFLDGEQIGRISFAGDTTRRIDWAGVRRFTDLPRGAHTVRIVMTRGPGFVDEFSLLGESR